MKQPSSALKKLVNKKARFNYEILEEVEAGIVLTGSEIKSLRAGRGSLDEAFGVIRAGEVFLRDFHIGEYEYAGYFQHAAKRERKLLLHRRQIKKWTGKVTERGLTLAPTEGYITERGLFKIRLALVRGKKTADKRESIKDRDQRRDMERALRRRD